MSMLKKRAMWVLTTLVLLVSLSMVGCVGPTQKDTKIPETQAAQIEENKSVIVSEPKVSVELKVHFIDVGQGDSILIQSGNNDMLIDAGEKDQGDKVVTYLHSMGISKLDYVIGTHPHSDHIGGLEDVLNNFAISKIMLPPVEHTTKTYEDLLNTIDSLGLKITKPVVGDTYQLGDATFQVIAPNKDYNDNLNNWSIGIKLINGNNSFIMCGDAESQSEADIVASGLDISADVLKLNHHGSKTSSTDAFLDKVNPKYAVISCGEGNKYGHPNKETIDKLTTRGIKVFRTDEQGTIVATSDGTNITWSTSPSITGKYGDAKENASQEVQKTTTAAETQNIPETEAQKSGETYVLNTKTKKFHKPTCRSLPTKNRKDTDKSRDELISEGYNPCKICNP